MPTLRQLIAALALASVIPACGGGSDKSGLTGPGAPPSNQVDSTPTSNAVAVSLGDGAPAGYGGASAEFGVPSETVAIDNVPWISQRLECTSWNLTKTCGPTTVAMAIAYVRSVTLNEALVHQIVEETHPGSWPCSIVSSLDELSATLTAEGVPHSRHSFDAVSLVRALKAHHPIIVPTITAVPNVPPVLDFAHHWGHFMLVVGVSPSTIVANDPGRSSATWGKGAVFDLSSFLSAWFANSSAPYDGIEIGPLSNAAPSALTALPSSVSTSSAALNATVVPNGLPTTAYFEYGTSTSYGTATPTQDMGAGTSAAGMTATLSGLTPGTVYHYRVATNATGSGHGADVTLATPTAGAAPSVTTEAPTGVTTSGATLHAAVASNGLATTVIFEIGETQSYGASTAAMQAGSSTGTSEVQMSTAGLVPGTTYHIRAVAANSAGSSHGNDVVFTTPSAAVSGIAPSAGASIASSVTQTGALLTANIDPGGASTSAWFEWGTSQAYGNATPSQSLTSGAAPATLTSALAGLTPGTTYHVRAVATNAAGTVHGPDAAFTTTAALAAHFTMNAGTQTVPDGGTLSVNGVPINGNVSVTFDASPTVAGGSSITSYVWRSNGTQIGTGSHLAYLFGTPNNTITLTVTNQSGATSTATGQVSLSFQASLSGPTAHFTMSAIGQTATDGGTVTFTNVPVNGNIPVNFSGTSSTAGTSAIVSYVWKSNGTQIGTGASLTFAFGTPSNTVTLTVTDASGLSSTATGQVNLSFASALPDLTASAQVAASYSAGQQGVQIAVTQTRSGGLLSNGHYVTARLYFSSAPTLNASSTLLWESNGSTPDFPIGVMNSVSSKSVIATVNIPAVASGVYYIIVVANADNYYAESTTSNNVVAYSVSIH